MKTILILALVVLSTFKSFSQNYTPFQFGNSRWAYNEIFFLNTTPYFYFSKDTTGIYVNGNKYWKIEKSSSQNYSPSASNLYLFDDTISKKVYFYNSSANTSNLLYDFSANVGDTVSSVYNYPSNSFNNVIIDSIKLMSSNSILRKHFYLHIVNSIITKVWIEGLGSTYDLLMPTNLLPDPVFELNCFQHNAITSFPDTLTNPNACKFSTLSIFENSSTTSISISPNPSNSHWTISTSNNQNTTAQITLADLQGKTFFNNHIQLSSQNPLTINSNNLVTGIYFLKITSMNTSKTYKLIKN